MRMAKIGRSAARELFLTGMRFSALRAREIGLVHAVVPVDQLDAMVTLYVNEVLSAAPDADCHRQGADPAGLGARRVRCRRADRRSDRRAARVDRRPGRAPGVPRKRKAKWNISS
jgi:enoyl-CoA hydratase/carnithine racemase